jgi:hypothetical protein
MRRWLWGAMAAFCFLGTVTTRADTMKVSDLEGICKTNNDTCRFFIWGFAQGFGTREVLADQRVNGQFVNRKPVLFCLPETETINTLTLRFKLKLAEDLVVFPNDRSEEATGFAAGILITLFPCKR